MFVTDTNDTSDYGFDAKFVSNVSQDILTANISLQAYLANSKSSSGLWWHASTNYMTFLFDLGCSPYYVSLDICDWLCIGVSNWLRNFPNWCWSFCCYWSVCTNSARNLYCAKFGNAVYGCSLRKEACSKLHYHSRKYPDLAECSMLRREIEPLLARKSLKQFHFIWGKKNVTEVAGEASLFKRYLSLLLINTL